MIGVIGTAAGAAIAGAVIAGDAAKTLTPALSQGERVLTQRDAEAAASFSCADSHCA
jgi:hypothetical protein